MIMRDHGSKKQVSSPSPTASADAQVIGNAVADARRALRLSQDDVAFAAHVSPRTVFAIEKGKPTVRLDMLSRVLGAVGLRLDAAPRDRVWRPHGQASR